MTFQISDFRFVSSFDILISNFKEIAYVSV